MDIDRVVANELKTKHELQFSEKQERASQRILNARHLSRELRAAECSNPLVREMMSELRATGGDVFLAIRSKDGGGREMGVWSLELRGDGFKVLVDRTDIDGYLKYAVVTIGDVLTDGLNGLMSYPWKYISDFKCVSPISARLRYFDITFDQVMDSIRGAAQKALKEQPHEKRASGSRA